MNTIKSLFAQKSWSNNELFNALAAVPVAKHAESVHTAVRTLNHIYTVDKIFQAHLLGEPHVYKATNTDATPELDELQFMVAETDSWYETYVSGLLKDNPLDKLGDSLNDSVSFVFTDGDTGTMSREEILLHVITHGAYHRGNVGQVLKSISIAPPRDLYTRFLHTHEPARRQARGRELGSASLAAN